MGCCSSQPPPEPEVPEPVPNDSRPVSPEIPPKRESILKSYQLRDGKQIADEKPPHVFPDPPLEPKKPDPLPVVTVSVEEIEPIQSLSTIVASFSGLHEVFRAHSNLSSKQMDIEGLTDALKIFGVKIDVNAEVLKIVWSKFSLDGADEIDYNDFMATISALIDTQNEDSMFLFFQIFDYDESGYLEVNELGEMLFAQQLLAAAVTNQPGLITDATNKICMKSAERFMKENDENGDGKISFEEYQAYRQKHEIVVQVGTPRVT